MASSISASQRLSDSKTERLTTGPASAWNLGEGAGRGVEGQGGTQGAT